MSPKPALIIKDLSKRFLLRHGRHKAEPFWVFKDLNLTINQGEAVGLIGRNGAGKSTLLKILARISPPTTGYVDVFGRISSLLEVGTGFNPELTGRENIYVNGAILGMKKKEIDKKFEAIVSFAEVEKFIDTPIKHYSSGMKVRLGFAVAVNLKSDILLIDEVLSVGDLGFQRKSLKVMSQIIEDSKRTIIFVSHNLASVQNLCEKSILLEDGQIKKMGQTGDVIEAYLSLYAPQEKVSLADYKNRKGTGQTIFTAINFYDAKLKHPLTNIVSGQDVVVEVAYQRQKKTQAAIKNLNLGLGFFTAVGQFIAVLNSEMANSKFSNLPPEGKVYCRIKKFPLMPGRFFLKATLKENQELVDQIDNALEITVEPGDFFGTGVTNSHERQGVYIEQNWSNSPDEKA